MDAWTVGAQGTAPDAPSSVWQQGKLRPREAVWSPRRTAQGPGWPSWACYVQAPSLLRGHRGRVWRSWQTTPLTRNAPTNMTSLPAPT